VIKKSLYILLIYFFIQNSFAAEQLTSLVNVKIKGEITKKTLIEFQEVLSNIQKNNQKIILNAIQLDSFGGNGSVGMQIGRLIRQKHLNTYISKDAECASACVFILLGGVQRYAFGEVDVHRSTYSKDIDDDSQIIEDIKKSEIESSKFIKEMGVSSLLFEAMNNTESWRIRKLTEAEKHKWQVFGTDRLEEEILFNKIARERYISRKEFIDIFSSNYEDCLSESRDLIKTVFECAKEKKIKKPSLYIQILRWINQKISPNDLIDPKLSFQQKVNLIREKIANGSLYRRYSEITEVTDAKWIPSKINSLSKSEVEKIEKTETWFVEGNKLSVFLINKSRYDLKEIIFSISIVDCKSKEANSKYLSIPFNYNLEAENSAVYSGQLPFDYNKVFGKGNKCGLIKAAYK